MKLKVRRFGIRTSTPLVVVIHKTDAISHDLHTTDRVEVRYRSRKATAVVDILDHHHDPGRSEIMGHGFAGLFEETAEALGVPDGAMIEVVPAHKPTSITYIQAKMRGEELEEEGMRAIVQDIVDGKLTDIELTSFVTAVSIRDLTFEETGLLTKAVAESGDRFETDKRPVIDKHCIGGVPGNRTTMIVIPILTAMGYTMPKTSSRAITSPSGTADTMECLANVSLTLEEMTRVVEDVGGCMVWGGAMRLAPADDKIIRIERPLSIDVTGLMLSSVMAKKYSVGATHVIIDIPYGPGSKVESREEAETLKGHFETLADLLGMSVLVILTDGSQPIGDGIGPLLEARDVMAVLRCEEGAPEDLREKGVLVAGRMLEFLGGCDRGRGEEVAREVLDSGRALEQMEAIIDSQGRVEQEEVSEHTRVFKASADGVVEAIDNKRVTKVSRLAGAPVTKTAGLVLHVRRESQVKAGDALFTVYCASPEKLEYVDEYVKSEHPVTLG